MSLESDFAALVSAYSDDLYRYACWLCRDPHRAEDLVQETLLRSWRGFASLRNADSARSWLLTTLRREHFRAAKPAPHLSLDDSDYPLADDELPHEVFALDSILDAQQRLNLLPQAYGEVLILQIYFGYSTNEIAEILTTTEAAVANRLLRARRAIGASPEAEEATVTALRRRSV